jgi:hypothetical protein
MNSRHSLASVLHNFSSEVVHSPSAYAAAAFNCWGPPACNFLWTDSF